MSVGRKHGPLSTSPKKFTQINFQEEKNMEKKEEVKKGGI